MATLPFTANDADLKLLEIYPRWHAAQTAWDAAEDEADDRAYGKRLAHLQAKCDETSAALDAIEGEAEAITGYGPVGAVVLLTMHRTHWRSSADEVVDAFRAIETLAQAVGLAVYDHSPTPPAQEAA